MLNQATTYPPSFTRTTTVPPSVPVTGAPGSVVPAMSAAILGLVIVGAIVLRIGTDRARRFREGAAPATEE